MHMHESQTILWMSKWLKLISQENGFPENLFNWSKVVHLGVYEAVHANTAGARQRWVRGPWEFRRLVTNGLIFSAWFE